MHAPQNVRIAADQSRSILPMEPESTDPIDPVMCHCSGTKRECIRSLFEQGMDIQAISRWTGALSGCGGCEWDIGDYLKALEAQRASGTAVNN